MVTGSPPPVARPPFLMPGGRRVLFNRTAKIKRIILSGKRKYTYHANSELFFRYLQDSVITIWR